MPFHPEHQKRRGNRIHQKPTRQNPCVHYFISATHYLCLFPVLTVPIFLSLSRSPRFLSLKARALRPIPTQKPPILSPKARGFQAEPANSSVTISADPKVTAGSLDFSAVHRFQLICFSFRWRSKKTKFLCLASCFSGLIRESEQNPIFNLIYI